MSDGKRRRARVQGGWAAPAMKPKGQTTAASSQTIGASPQANCIGGNLIDTSSDSPQKFVFQEPEQPIRQKPPVKTIELEGVHDLSTSPDGVAARIRWMPHFIDAQECEWMFEQLHQEIPWRQRSEILRGVEALQPRMTAWYGDFPYYYSGMTHDANTQWSPMLTMLNERLEEETGLKFNSMLANLYRDGHDSVGWHSDDEPSLRNNPTIASLSFGDTRMFEMRKKPPKEEQGDYTYMQHIRIPLTAGSLLIMEGSTQTEWQHQIPREYHDRDARINLTFRVIYPE